MFGDGHVRNCAAECKDNLGANYEFNSFVKPGAGMDTVINTAKYVFLILAYLCFKAFDSLKI
jgi:hypothetical protein